MSSGPFYVDGVQVMAPPPNGWVPDIVNPARNWDIETYVIAGVGNTLVLLFMYQRLYVRWGVMRRFDFGDAALILAWIFSTVEQILILHALATKIIGVHFWELPVSSFRRFEYQVAYLVAIFFPLVQMFTKLVLILFYRTLIPQVWFKHVIYVMTFFIVGTYVGILVASIFPCKPIARGWNSSIEGTCIDVGALYKMTAILGIIHDICLILLPLPIIIRLQVPLRQKIGLVLIFSVGFATVITSVVRYFILVQMMQHFMSDLTWYAAETSGWVVIESNLYIMCACMPTLRRFFGAVAPHLVGIYDSDRESGSRPSRRTDWLGNQLPTLVTIGGTGGTGDTSGDRTHSYSRFGDDDPEAAYGLETIVYREDSRRNDTDDNSERGIIQTQSVTVTFSGPEVESSSK